MHLWHLLLRHAYKSDNPENLIILIILVQTTARGQSTKSTPNTRTEIVQTIVLLSLTHFSIVFKENSASFSFRFLNVVSRKSGFQSPPTRVFRSYFPHRTPVGIIPTSSPRRIASAASRMLAISCCGS